MEERNCLFFQKGSGDVVNSFEEWGVVCLKVPFKVGGKTKEPAKRTWLDEHGEDVFLPQKLMMEAYDAEFELGCSVDGNGWDLGGAMTRIKAFKEWLSGNDETDGSGAELKIYSPFAEIGRQGCYLVEMGDEEYHLQAIDGGCRNVVTFKVTFRVTDPVTDVVI